MVSFGLYQHHGIATDKNRVVHFGRGAFDAQNAVVEEVTMDEFCRGRPISLFNSEAGFASVEIVARARGRIGEQNYCLFENNCEHFANWCRTGRKESPQVNLSETIARQTTAALTRPWLKKLAVTMASKAASTRVSTVALAGVGAVPPQLPVLPMPFRRR